MIENNRIKIRKARSLSGKKGVILDKRKNTFNAILSFTNGRTKKSITIHIGNYKTIDEAYNARKNYLLNLID